MKRLIVIGSLFLLFCQAVQISAQQCEISLMPFMPEQVDRLPVEAESFLRNKLTQIAVQNGLASEDYAQFALSPQITLITKDIIPGAPVNFAYSMEVTLFISDYFGQKVFCSTTLPIKGVGTNEAKAYIDGIKHINVNNRHIQNFIDNGKSKIVAYYDANYAHIIKKAQSLAGMKNYDEAMFLLMSIPSCSVGYDSALKAASQVYQKYVDDLCLQNLAKARVAWMQEQNSSGANEAGLYLQYIYPEAQCYNEAMALYKEIKAKVHEDWKFVMKMYDDAVSLEKQRINAWKEVGTAYGKGQQPVTTNVVWLRQ